MDSDDRLDYYLSTIERNPQISVGIGLAESIWHVERPLIV